MKSVSFGTSGWTTVLAEALAADGVVVVLNAVPEVLLSETRRRLDQVQEAFTQEVGADKLRRAGESGVLRLMMRYDDHFCRYLELPSVLEVIDATVGPTAVMHLQNGFVLPSHPGPSPATFQNHFHRDFPRWMNGYLASVNTLVAVDEFTGDNGATRVIPGSHKWQTLKSQAEMERTAVAATCPAGSLLVFDSMLAHAAGQNRSGKPRRAINQQFTRSFFKQQLDYVRALGPGYLTKQKERTQQLLGQWTRVPASLAEYYVPEAERVYRKDQG